LIAVLKARWGVEVNLRHLKTSMRMNVLRSQSVAGVERELWMYAIVHNAVRLVMLEAAARQRVSPDRISFADALYWVRHGDFHQPLPDLLLVPFRPGRIEPRLKKRRNDDFGLLTKPRNQLKRALRGRMCVEARFSAIRFSPIIAVMGVYSSSFHSVVKLMRCWG
jgi:hypothetical protein